VLAAVLDGGRPNGRVVGQPIAEKLRSIVQPRVALLSNHFRSGGDGLLHELDDVGFSLESLTRRIVALAEVGPDYEDPFQRQQGVWPQLARAYANSFVDSPLFDLLSNVPSRVRRSAAAKVEQVSDQKLKTSDI
jgi:hypothetical protein